MIICTVSKITASETTLSPHVVVALRKVVIICSYLTSRCDVSCAVTPRRGGVVVNADA